MFKSVISTGVVGVPDGTPVILATPYCTNVYVDLDGTIHPHVFPKEGLWTFDGQCYYLDKKRHPKQLDYDQYENRWYFATGEPYV